MFNYLQQSQKQNVIAFVCLVFMFWSSHIGLDYVLRLENGERVRLPYGQYFFFFSSFIPCVYLIYSTGIDNFLAIFSRKKLWIALGFLLLGISLSSTSAWGWRLFAIVGSISLFSVAAANFVHNLSLKNQAVALLLLVMPFSVPVLGAVILELFGPIDIGVVLINTKHMNYTPPRWHFLNMYANGFGFDAALLSLFLLISIFYTRTLVFRMTTLILLIIAMYALIASGTRAAVIFFIVSSFSFFLLSRRMKHFTIGSALISLLLLSTFSLDTMINWLRLSSDIEVFSSHRWSGLVGMWSLFTSSPFRGLGFGAADGYFTSYGRFPVDVSNIFYVGLLAEVGFFGFLGVVMLLAFPAKYVFTYVVKKRGVDNPPYLFMFSASVLAGFVPYLMFEFDVLRVSVNHQLFFFCWGVLVFHFIKADQNSSY